LLPHQLRGVEVGIATTAEDETDAVVVPRLTTHTATTGAQIARSTCSTECLVFKAHATGRPLTEIRLVEGSEPCAGAVVPLLVGKELAVRVELRTCTREVNHAFDEGPAAHDHAYGIGAGCFQTRSLINDQFREWEHATGHGNVLAQQLGSNHHAVGVKRGQAIWQGVRAQHARAATFVQTGGDIKATIERAWCATGGPQSSSTAVVIELAGIGEGFAQGTDDGRQVREQGRLDSWVAQGVTRQVRNLLRQGDAQLALAVVGARPWHIRREGHGGAQGVAVCNCNEGPRNINRTCSGIERLNGDQQTLTGFWVRHWQSRHDIVEDHYDLEVTAGRCG